uniref:Jacalin-type lectin domain-containing protein n=1 Tax=Paramormyrops kingsleyae TaxID=1676925 RepID=A0A3B3SXG6_9TELE
KSHFRPILKIRVWVGGWQVKALKVWLTDDQSKQFGIPAGDYSEFTFEDGEQITSLSLWDNGAGTRLGAIKFGTNRRREFFAYMTEWPLKKEHQVDTGSGICMGIKGGSGTDIDRLGFVFINTIKSTVLTKVQYTFHQLVPSVAVEKIGSMTYQNTFTAPQEYKTKTSMKITEKFSWSVPNKMSSTFKMKVHAGIPEVVENKTGFSYKLGSESTYDLENTEEKTELINFTVNIPPGKTVKADITIGQAPVDLPYTGTVKITCLDDSVLEIPTSGTYKGLTYTSAKAGVKELP